MDRAGAQEAFNTHLDRLLGPVIPPHIAVAVSGGADSIYLALRLKSWAAHKGVALQALTVDHGLRANAAEEAAQVGVQMQCWGIAHTVLTWVHTGIHSRIQETARAARYTLLLDTCRTQGISHLFLAHHADDQAETFLFRLSSGSGIDGLGSMRALTSRGGISIVRPLLEIPKQMIVDALQVAQISWIQDPSNDNPQFTRVRIRQAAPAFSDLGLGAQKLGSVAHKLQRSIDALLFYTITFLKAHAILSPLGYVQLKIPEVWPPADIQLRAISWILMHVSGAHYPPRQASVLILLEKLQREAKRLTCGGCWIERHGETWIFMREPKHLRDVIVHPGQTVRWDRRFEVCLKGVTAPMTLGPAGSLPALRSFSEAPSSVCAGLLALKLGGKVVGIPGLDFYPAPAQITGDNVEVWAFRPQKNLFTLLFTIA